LASGVNVAVLDPKSYVTAPLTAPPPFSVKFDVVMVDESIASEKVAVIVVLIATLFAPFAGFLEEMVGAVVSGASAVVNDHE
jgi:hypothetical protein